MGLYLKGEEVEVVELYLKEAEGVMELLKRVGLIQTAYCVLVLVVLDFEVGGEQWGGLVLEATVEVSFLGLAVLPMVLEGHYPTKVGLAVYFHY